MKINSWMSEDCVDVTGGRCNIAGKEMMMMMMLMYKSEIEDVAKEKILLPTNPLLIYSCSSTCLKTGYKKLAAELNIQEINSAEG